MRNNVHNYKSLLDKDPNFKEWIESLAIESPTSADVALRRIGYVCRVFNLTTKQISKMSTKDGLSLINKLVKQLANEKKSRGYINNYVIVIKQFFDHNQKPIEQKVKLPRDDESKRTKVQTEQVPTPEQFGRALDNASIEQKVRATLIGFCGFRPETLGNFNGTDGLRIKDLPELKIDHNARKVEFSQIPTMIICRPSLSKAGHRYFSFMPTQGCNYIQELLEQRLRHGEDLKQDSFLITSLKYTGKTKSDYKGGAIKTSKVSSSVRRALRKAGLDVRPYVLRSYFETWLMTAEAAGLFLRDYRVFIAGHKGDIEHRYSVNKEGLPQETIEQMRSMYAKAAEKYLVTIKSHDITTDKIRAQFNEQMLRINGFTPEQIAELGDLGSLSDEQMAALLRDNHKQALGLNGNGSQKVVPRSEVKNWINDGWEWVAHIDDKESIIKLPKS